MKFIKLLLFLFLISCNLNEYIENHGLSNLKLIVNELKINSTNQNDATSLIGAPLIKDTYDKNIWFYFETIKKINLFGNQQTIISNAVILKFDKSGILVDYIYYDINDLKKIKFDKSITESKALNKNFLENILSNSKKRFDLRSKDSNPTNER